MINRDSYSKEAIESLYAAVETAMENDHILDLEDIAYLIHEVLKLNLYPYYLFYNQLKHIHYLYTLLYL